MGDVTFFQTIFLFASSDAQMPVALDLSKKEKIREVFSKCLAQTNFSLVEFMFHLEFSDFKYREILFYFCYFYQFYPLFGIKSLYFFLSNYFYPSKRISNGARLADLL